MIGGFNNNTSKIILDELEAIYLRDLGRLK